jgi:hypothetical protein
MPKRIQRQRTKGWKMPGSAVYVGRPSIYGNPYIIDAECQHLSWFRNDIIKESSAIGGPTDPSHEWSEHFWRMSRSLYMLKGRDLACWCAFDQPCHADVLLELANAPPAPPLPSQPVTGE